MLFFRVSVWHLSDCSAHMNVAAFRTFYVNLYAHKGPDFRILLALEFDTSVNSYTPKGITVIINTIKVFDTCVNSYTPKGINFLVLLRV